MVFFSGTDWSELEDNAPNHNYYLSIIVNNKLEIIGKLCYILDNEIKGEALDDEGKKYVPEIIRAGQNKTLVVYNCKIILESQKIEVEEEFTKQVDKIIAEADKKQKTFVYKPYTKKYSPSPSFATQYLQKHSKPSETKDYIISNIEDADIENFALDLVNNFLSKQNQVSDVEEGIGKLFTINYKSNSIPGKIIEDFNDIYSSSFYFVKDKNEPEVAIKVVEETIKEFEILKEMSLDYPLTEYYEAFISGLTRLLTE